VSEELLINVTPQETRVAVVENGVLQEVHIERALSRGVVGNIYKGKVSRILPGMQAAFVDVGLDRATFLHASDVHLRPAGRVYPEGATPAIHELLHDGQEVVVQVIKDPLGTKGARVTTHITLPTRYLVYMPYSKHIGISQKIEDDVERERLRSLLKSALEGHDVGGFILRTVAGNVSEDELTTDIRYLKRLWSVVEQRMTEAPTQTLLHEDLTLALRAMRDLVRHNVEKVRIDSRETFVKARDFAINFIPEVAERIELYPGERPIFDLYGVEDEIQKALDRKVLLKSGG